VHKNNQDYMIFKPKREQRQAQFQMWIVKLKFKKKNKNRTNANKNPTKIHCKEEIKQGYDKKMHPKLILNKINVMKNYTFIYTH